MPEISVIVPVYNTEKYLPRCIDSILAQTFTDFELILVDDGSTDRSGSICEEYAEIDSRVRVFHQENKGQAAARNLALDWVFANSDSDYLSFVDSDDWVHPEYLESLIDAAVSDSCVSVCYYTLVDDSTEIVDLGSGETTQYSFEDYFCMRVEGLDSVCPVCRLYPKKLFENIRFPEGRICEDLFIIPKLLYHSNCIVVIDKVLYYYYQSDSSTMRSEWNTRRLDEIEASHALISFVKKNCSPRAVEKAERRSIWVIEKQLNEIKESSLFGSKYHRLLIRNYRRALIRNRKLFPIKTEYYRYETAFPGLAWIYWTSRAVFAKLKRM